MGQHHVKFQYECSYHLYKDLCIGRIWKEVPYRGRNKILFLYRPLCEINILWKFGLFLYMLAPFHLHTFLSTFLYLYIYVLPLLSSIISVMYFCCYLFSPSKKFLSVTSTEACGNYGNYQDFDGAVFIHSTPGNSK